MTRNMRFASFFFFLFYRKMRFAWTFITIHFFFFFLKKEKKSAVMEGLYASAECPSTIK